MTPGQAIRAGLDVGTAPRWRKHDEEWRRFDGAVVYPSFGCWGALMPNGRAVPGGFSTPEAAMAAVDARWP